MGGEGEAFGFLLPLFHLFLFSFFLPSPFFGFLGPFQPPSLLQVRLASLSTSMCPTGRCRRCCPTCPAGLRKTGASWSGQTGSGTFSGGKSSGGSLPAPSLAPATNLNCASSPAPLVPSPTTNTAIPQPSPAAVALPAPFSRGGDMSLLLFEPHTPPRGHYCRTAPRAVSPSQGLELGCLRGRAVRALPWGFPIAAAGLAACCLPRDRGQAGVSHTFLQARTGLGLVFFQ